MLYLPRPARADLDRRGPRQRPFFLPVRPSPKRKHVNKQKIALDKTLHGEQNTLFSAGCHGSA